MFGGRLWCVVQTGLELPAVEPLLPKCWDSRCASQRLAPGVGSGSVLACWRSCAACASDVLKLTPRLCYVGRLGRWEFAGEGQ